MLLPLESLPSFIHHFGYHVSSKELIMIYRYRDVYQNTYCCCFNKLSKIYSGFIVLDPESYSYHCDSSPIQKDPSALSVVFSRAWKGGKEWDGISLCQPSFIGLCLVPTQNLEMELSRYSLCQLSSHAYK